MAPEPEDRERFINRSARRRAEAENDLADLELLPDQQAAVEAAVVVAQDAHEVSLAAANTRNRIAAGIRDRLSLSLAELGSRIGVSRSLAQQWDAKGRTVKTQREDADG